MQILTIFSLILLSQNLSAQYEQNFLKDVEGYAETLALPTLAVGVAKGDNLIFYKGIGTMAPVSQAPITKDDIFTIASVTKTFTAVVMEQLEDEGKISLNDLIDSLPNQYFTTNRWNKNTTLAHILSNTSESRPIGKNFVYNGSKFNIVFNVFSKLHPDLKSQYMTRPFTIEVEKRILNPLHMDHSVVQYDETKHSQLIKYVVTPYAYNQSEKNYKALPIDLAKMQCGPGFGMMSSLSDLVTFSSALDKSIIITRERYKRMTTPFYKGSPYGLGWFTFNFEGFDVHWAYGYGDSNSAILLKVPSKNLTLILLSSCAIPSESTRLGYGNPFNSPIVDSFFRNYVLNLPGINLSDKNINRIYNDIKEYTIRNKSRIYLEEAFAEITTNLFGPIASSEEKEKYTQLLKSLIKNYPKDPLWKSTTATELLASIGDNAILKFETRITNDFYKAGSLHPAQIFYAGVIREKLNNMPSAIRLFKILAEGDSYQEQPYKFDSLMKLAKYYRESNPDLCKQYLLKLIKFKEFINAQDDQYNEAKTLLSDM